MAEFSISADRAHDLENQATYSGSASVASMRELASKMRAAQNTGAGRFGRILLNPLYQLLAEKRGQLPHSVANNVQWWAAAPSQLTPRSLRSIEVTVSGPTCAGFTGGGFS